jgi:hypothetical protein
VSSFTYDTSDLDRAAIAIHRFANYIDDEEVLQGAKRIAMDDMKRRFETELDPTGARWQELSHDYQIEKAESGYQVHPILSRTYHDGNSESLRSAATSEEAWSVSGESVWFHTGGLPPYWEAHETGRQWTPHWAKIGDKEVGADASGGMPQRRFIGLSDEAREEIVALTGAWLEAGLAQTVAPFKSHIAPVSRRFGESFGGGTISSFAAGAGRLPQYRVTGPGIRGAQFGPMV